MKKYFVITLITTLFLTSCFKKEEENTTATSTVSTGNEVSKTEETTNTKVEEEISTGDLENFEEEKIEFGTLTEQGENISYKDSYKGYEVNFKKSEGLEFLSGEKIYPAQDFIAYSKKTGNSIGFISSTIPEEHSNFESFAIKFYDDTKNEETIKNLQKTETEVSGLKGYKHTYELNGDLAEQYIVSEGKNVFLITFLIKDKTSEKQFRDILNGFKLLK